MLISTIIVSWNTRALTLAAVESVLTQEVDAELEVIVVDNGSTDDTVAALRERYPAVRVIATGRNLGFAAGNNVGLRRVRGEYTFLLNSDARARPGCLQTLLDEARRHPRAAAFQPKQILPDGSVQLTCGYEPGLPQELWLVLVTQRWVRGRAWQARMLAGQESERVRSVGLAALFVPTRVWSRIGRLSEETFLFFEEADLSTRLRRAGLPLRYVPAAVVDHLVGQSTGQTPYIKRRAHYLSRLWYYRRHCHPLTAALVRRLSAARAAVGLLRDPAGADALWRPVLRRATGGDEG